jgi:hypothetical protein
MLYYWYVRNFTLERVGPQRSPVVRSAEQYVSYHQFIPSVPYENTCYSCGYSKEAPQHKGAPQVIQVSTLDPKYLRTCEICKDVKPFLFFHAVQNPSERNPAFMTVCKDDRGCLERWRGSQKPK